MKNASQIPFEFQDPPQAGENAGVGVRIKSLKKAAEGSKDKQPENRAVQESLFGDAPEPKVDSAADNSTEANTTTTQNDGADLKVPDNELANNVGDADTVHDNVALNYTGIDNAGLDINGPDNIGLDTAGLDSAAIDSAVLNNAERADEGFNNAGLANEGLDNAGLEFTTGAAQNETASRAFETEDEQSSADVTPNDILDLSAAAHRTDNGTVEKSFDQGDKTSPDSEINDFVNSDLINTGLISSDFISDDFISTDSNSTDAISTDSISTDIEITDYPTADTLETESTPAKAPKSTRGRKSLKTIDEGAELINVPPDEQLFQKQYYAIGEVAEMFHVNQSLLRFWETEFDIIQPRKNRKGDRHFRPVDIKNLLLIHDLLRRRKLTIEGAKDFLKKNKRSPERFAMIQSLQRIKGFILEIKATL